MKLKQRAQGIIIRKDEMLFGTGLRRKRKCHYLIGGGIEDGETPEEAMHRELKEEINADGTILFKFSRQVQKNHHTFLIDIGDQKVTVGNEPDETGIPLELRELQGLEFISLKTCEKFTDVDEAYLEALIMECNDRNYFPNWYYKIKRIVDRGLII